MSRLLPLLAAAAGLAAASLDDFARSEPGFTALAPAAVALVPAPAGATGQALRLSWPAERKRWIEGYYAQALPVPDLLPEAGMVLRLRLWLPPASPVRQISVRLQDAKHEMWQWGIAVAPPAAGGWIPLAIPVAIGGAAGHWGGDGVPDPPFALAGWSAAFADARGAGELALAAVTVEPLPAMQVETARFPGLVDPGAGCSLALANRGDAELAVEIAATASDWAGGRREGGGGVVLPPHGNGRIALPLTARPGYQALAWTMRIGDLVVPGTGAVVVGDALPPRRRDGFRFGICSHPERLPAAEQEREMRAVAAAGATVVRCSAAWSMLEPKPGEWHWEVQDRLVELAAANGLEIQGQLGYGVAHAAPPAVRAAEAEAWKARKPDAWKIGLFSPPEAGPWRAYVAASAARYRGRIRMWEVWNEPDLGFFRGSVEDYIGLLRIAGEEVHRADPAAALLTGGFATVLDHPGRALNPAMQERVLREASDAFDVHAVHQHGPFAEFQAACDGELRRLRGLMPQPRPLYFNETAMCAYGGGPEAERMQACELVKKIAWVVARGAIGHTWYDLRNDGWDRADPEDNYGLLARDFRPKPAFGAYREVVRRLRGVRPLPDLDLGPGRWGLVFAGTERRIALLWREDPRQPDEPIAIRSGGPARRCDIQGGDLELMQSDGVAVVRLGDEPCWLELPPGETSPEAGPLLALRGDATVAPGAIAAFTAMARNPLPRPLDLHLTWRGPEGKDAVADLALAAGAGGEAAVTMAAGTASAAVAEVSWTAGPWRGVLRCPLRLVRAIGGRPPEGREPDVVLAGPADVVNLCGGDPAMAAHLWRGPDDLGARLWWWLEGGTLHLQIDVRDDEHDQRQASDAQWRGDGVQFALQPTVGGPWWELGAARRRDNGEVMRACWRAPPAGAGAAESFTAAIDPLPGGMRYRIDLPCVRFGLSPAVLAEGFRMNLIVNDCDGGVREGFARLAPGIGESKDPAAFPLFRAAAR